MQSGPRQLKCAHYAWGTKIALFEPVLSGFPENNSAFAQKEWHV